MTPSKPRGAAASPRGAAAKRIIDLDAARAARLETANDPPVVTIGGETFQLPPELNIDVVDHASAGEFKLAVLAMFGGDEAEAQRFLDAAPGGLSMLDLKELLDQLEAMYGMAEGD